MTINGLTLKTTPLATDRIELNDGQSAALSTLPVSTPMTSAIATSKADCVQLTGNQTVAGIKTFSSSPVVPTAATGTTTTQAASTAFVQQELGAGVASARALIVTVRNQSGSTMTAGTVVYISGATGNNPLISRAQATIDATSAQTIGLVQADIANNGTGSVVIRGVVSGLNTQALTEGQQLYLSPTVAGGYTTTKQYAPNHLVYVGIVTRSHPTLGTIEVAIQNGYEMDEIHDVSAQNPTNGDVLRYNSTTGLWEKSALTAASVTNTPAGNIAAATVQAAINELDSEKTTPAAALAAADAAIKSAFIAYAPDGYLNSDGATSNRCAGIQGPFDAVNNPRGWVAGAATLTWRGVVTVPSAVLASVIDLASLATATTLNTAGYSESNTIRINLFSNFLDIYQLKTPSDTRRFNFGTFRSTYSGQTGILEIYFIQGTTNPVVRWNEVDISASFSASTAGTPPAWLDAAMVPTYHLTGYNWPSGPAPVGSFILGSLTDADRAFHRSTGQYPAWVVAGGSMKNWLTGDSATFTSSLGSWASYAAGVASLVSNKMRITFNGSNGGATIGLLLTASPVGRKYTLKVTLSGVSATGTALLVGGEFDTKANIALTNGTQYIDFETRPAGVGNFLIYGVGLTGTVDFDDLLLYERGALSLPGIQPCAVVDDLTTIGGNQARLVGVTAVTPKRDWRISADTWLNSNQRILEGALIDSTADIIDSIEQTTTGTPTTTIGSASAGSQYKASGALTAGINPTTLVTRKAASNEFWVGSNSTAVVRTTIKGHRAI